MFLKSSEERRVGLGGAGALSHVYIQNPPLRCNISGSRGLFYDDGNKLLLSPTSEQVFSWKTSPLLSVNDAPTSDSISDGPILSIRYSLDGKVIGIQRSNHEIEFKNKETGETFMQRCKLESESILGFFWTDCSTCDIVLIKTSGLDLFSYESESKALHLVESKRLNVSWYLYTHESRLVLLASGMQCKTFVGFQFSSGGIIRLPKFEMEMAKAEANSKPVLAAEDVHIVTVYGRIYCLQVDSVGMMAHLYRFYRDAVVQQGSLPIYSSRIGVSVVDNVLLVHQVDAKVVILYDIFSNSEAPISAPLPLLLRSGSRFDASSSQTIHLESTDASVHGVMYGDGWTFLVPDLICDPVHGTVWRIHLDLEAISASSSEVPFILEFLQRRRLESSKAKQLCIAIMRTVILERRSVTMISWAMDVLVASYSQLVKMGLSLQGGANNISSNPSRIVIDEQISRLKTHGYNIGPDSVNRPLHEHVNPTKGSVSDTDENINPEFEKNRKGEIYGLGGKEGLKQPSIEGSGSEDVETSSLQHEVVGSCSNAFGSNPSDPQGSQVACTTISPDEMYTFVFAVVEEEMAPDPAYLVGIIVEYLRSAASEKLKVHPNMYVLTIQLLARCERYAELGLFIINKILEPSKEVALQLLESGRQNVQTRRLGLDMLRQLALHHDYVSILVQDGYYFEALRYARKHKVLILQPSTFLDAAFTSNNPQELAAVLRFFSSFTPSFNTTADFTTYYRILNEMC